MREILFRGKRVDDGEWVYGSFVMDGTELTAIEDGKKPLASWGFIRRYNAETGKVDMFEVERETIGQYIGLICNHGKNSGKRIFEGDIVNLYTFTGKRDLKGAPVEFDGCCMQWTAAGRNLYGEMCSDILEIIGNIHDNPELLGGADNG